MHHGHERHRGDRPGGRAAVGAPLDDAELLRVGVADGDHEPAAGRELIDERLRYLDGAAVTTTMSNGASRASPS